VEGALWPAKRIADELVRRGLGGEVLPILRRTKPVGKSSRAAPGERTEVGKHLETLALDNLLSNPPAITIVDDVVTKGRMLLASAALLAERFPKAEIRAFALVRTLGLQPDVERILEPCLSRIRAIYGDASRED
jgi:predicted amidophosphoribosyltransferase